MKKIIPTGLVLLLTATGLGLVSCAETDVVGQVAATSFDAVVAQLGEEVTKSETEAAWQITSPSGDLFLIAEDFSRPNSGESPDLKLVFDAAPFLAAGLDGAKLATHNALLYQIEGGKLKLHFDWGEAGLKTIDGGSGITATFRQILATYRERIGYHEKLDHYGFVLGDGNMVEWAKDLSTNDIDYVFVLNPQPLIAAGLDPAKLEGWVFAKVEIKEANGQTLQVDKLLRPFSL